MSLKDNFNQADRDLLKKDALVGSDMSKKSKQKSDLDRYLDTPLKSEPEVETASFNDFADDIPPMPKNVEPAKSSYSSESMNRTPVYSQQPVPTQPTEGAYFEGEETTISSRNTIIDGNIRSFANINVEGSIKGDVQVTKNANISGKLVGDLECNNAAMLGSSMQGNVTSKGSVRLDRDSLILGDIQAQFAEVNGKVKGNLEVGGKAEFKTDAIILGNINAATITVLDGATIQGYVNTTFLQETSSNIFPDAINVSE